MSTKLRLTGRQHELLRRHLFPGDGNEAVALCLCGLRRGVDTVLSVQSVHPIPYEMCSVRRVDAVVWSTDSLPTLLEEAARRGRVLLKVHSHPQGFDEFSTRDDASDRSVFASAYGWVDGPGPHASAVMLPGGRMFGRAVSPTGGFEPLESIAVAGDDIRIWRASEPSTVVPEFMLRHQQLFGEGTSQILRRLSIAIVGASGSGSPMFELALRLGVGRIVLVDPQAVEEKNLNRIINATYADIGRPKVTVLSAAAQRIGLGTDVVPIAKSIANTSAVHAVATCDVLFGCVDSAEARHLLSRLATFYCLPYIDVGVQIDADGNGGVDQICGAVHYLQPDGSSLLSRRAYSLEDVRAEEARRVDPERYKGLLDDGYIKGVRVEQPAVIHLNTLVASLAINELLARLHPFRLGRNAEFWVTRLSLTGGIISEDQEPEPPPCEVLSQHVGRGDVSPRLAMPEIVEDEVQDAS
ncbi:MAG: ThiF family adenylyltransferase [Planctomycetes bacterium]|nr:ThiF family adenylyltransferase [Planctomycetota bacterium]